MDDKELVPVTTYVPRGRVAAFQLYAAQWVSTAKEPPSRPSRPATRPASDERPDWGTGQLELARLIRKKMDGSVAARALSYMANRPGIPLSAGALAVALDLASDEQDVTGWRRIAGC